MENDKMSISEIAEELGMSSSTVSRAISGKGRVSDATKSRVLEYIAESGKTPHIRTSKFSDKKTMNICVTIPGEGDYAELPYFTRMIMTLYDFFVIRDYNIILVKTRSDDIGALRDIIRRHKVDGVILTRVLENWADIMYLKEKQVPFVVTGNCQDESVYQVDVDQRGGCHDLTDNLIKMGTRRMALLCGDLRQMVSQDRRDGYLAALRENNIPIERHLIAENAADRNVLEKVVLDILKEQVECIICSDDGICLSLLDYFREIGMTVPRDVRVASFYNSMVLNEYHPAITSLDFDIREMGRAAGNMLLRLLEGLPCEKKKVLGYKLLIKESTNFAAYKPSTEVRPDIV